MAGAVAFVGREGELSRLLGALGGDTRLVLVTGDAGVGKTRFVGEGMARAVAAGMVVVRGECLPLAGDAAAAAGRRPRWVSWAGWMSGGLLAAALDGAAGVRARRGGAAVAAAGAWRGMAADGHG